MISKWTILVFLMTATAVSADAGTKTAKLAELMKIQGLTEMIAQQQAEGERQAKSMGEKMLAEVKKQMPEVDTSATEGLGAAYAAFIEKVKPTWTVEEAIAAWAQYYGEHVTEKEVDKILAFYKSPIGQKDIAATKSAMPKWYAFFAEKNQKLIDSATAAYIEDVRGVVQRARKKQESIK